MKQKIFTADKEYFFFTEYMKTNNLKNVFLVCDKSVEFLRINDYFAKLEKDEGFHFVRFSDFNPNPDYTSVKNGIKYFLENACDIIIAVGGGSAIDVAKCIKLFSNMNHNFNYLQQEIIPNNIPFAAVPTTAGTGSEATRYAVIYYNGEKQSITHDSCIPEFVLMDYSVLDTLPEYQRKATMLDALCHAVESYWSVNSTKESRNYSDKAIRLIVENMDNYLHNAHDANKCMMQASYIAGKAINITQTTAGHAMCYKLTTLCGIAHGHAAAMCTKTLYRFMNQNINKCIDNRGQAYLTKVFFNIAEALGCKSTDEGIDKLNEIFDSLNLFIPDVNLSDYDKLVESVNPVRLKNNPVELDCNAINQLYHQILDK